MTKTWTETHEVIARRAGLSEWARAWVLEQVGGRDGVVSRTARQLSVAWWPVMDQVIDRGTAVIADPARLAEVSAVGVDETALLRATGKHPRMFATGVAELSPGRPARLLDIVEGRSGTVLALWLAQRDPDWRAGVATGVAGPVSGLRHGAGHLAARRGAGAGPVTSSRVVCGRPGDGRGVDV